MKRLICAVSACMMLLTACADTTATTASKNENKVTSDAQSSAPEEVTAPEATGEPQTSSSDTGAATKSPEEIESEKIEVLKDGAKTVCNIFGLGAQNTKIVSDALIVWWEMYDFSNFKKVEGKFESFADEMKSEYGVDIYENTVSISSALNDALSLYETMGYDDLTQPLGDCREAYKELYKVTYEFSGTMKEYKEAFALAYNEYVDKCNACMELFVEKELIGSWDIVKLSKLEQETPDNSGDSSTLTTGQKNSLKTAKSYLNYSTFSYDGLIDQLEYEGYSHEEAVYAVNNCGADWREQALLCAKSYLKHSSFSYSGLIEQLEYEQFSHDDAVYAADYCGADWFEQAAITAESYLKYSSFSRSGLIDQLEYEGFTKEQAVYGVEQNGY